jgi:hypothetical protein
MIKLEYFLVAESYAVDENRNTISIFHVLEEFGAHAAPIIVPKLSAISSWLVSEDHDPELDHHVTIRVSGGALEAPLEYDFVMSRGPRTRHRMFHSFQGAVFDAFGDAVFELLLDGEHRASHTLTLEEVPAPPEPAEAQPTWTKRWGSREESAEA